MQETRMDREIRERVGRVQARLRAKLARVEARKKAAGKEVRRVERRFPYTLRDLVAKMLVLWALGKRLWWLECRRYSLEGKLRYARERAVWEWHEETAAREHEERERRLRIREAAADLRRKYGGRPAMVCGREPETWEELRLVEGFLAGAEKRHELCLEAWRRADYDSRHQERVRERLERDLPLRRYEQ